MGTIPLSGSEASDDLEVAKGSENTKLLLKPPRIVHKPTSLPTVPSNRDVSGSIQMKTNGRRTSAGNGANQQGVVAFSKTTGDSRGMSSRSISLPKPTPSHLNTMVFSSSSSPTPSHLNTMVFSSHSVKSPLENSRKRSALRNSDQSLSGTTTRTPIRTSKSKLGPSNFKFSSKASPSSSIDSFVSEGSSSTSTSIKPSNSVESLSSATSSSPSVVSIEQPCIKKDASSNRLQSQPTAKGSLGTRVLSEPSNKDHAIRSSTSSNTGAKNFKPSGLRMPSPKIGYFDAKHYILGINPMALPQQTPLIIINNDEDDDQCLTDQQLLSRTERYLSILEQRVEDQYRNFNPHQIEVLSTRRQMLEALRTILNKSHQLVYSGSAQGFVFGLITENKIWTASSDNFRRWWKEDVDFEKNGPRALLSPNVSETLALESLKVLQDSTLSSIISALMQKCTPSQRSCPFHLGKPVGWWPTGTEEWWSQLNFPEDIGPPEYRKPHDLKKQCKVAVLVAVIKNLEPDFEKIRRLECESQTVQNKMTHKENSIWLAVIRGEEKEMRYRLQLSDPESGLSNDNVKALGNSSTGSNIGGIVDKESEVCLEPSSLIKVESSDMADEETEALPSSLMKGESSEANKFKRIAIAEPEMIPIRSPTFSQGPILETIGTATSEGETSRRQKLKGLAIADTGTLKLPTYQSGSCRGSSIFSLGSMNTNHQFPHQFQTNNMLHPSAMNYRLSNSTLRPSQTAFSMPYAKPGRFGVPTSLGSNNNQVNSSNFGGPVSNNNHGTSSNFGGQISGSRMNSFKFSGQISNNNQVNSSNFGGQMSNSNQVNSSSSGGQIASANLVNFSNFGGQMSNSNQVNSSNFGGQISNYLNSTTNGMNISSLNVASIPQSSNFARPINNQVIRAEGGNMQRTSAADSTMQNLELEGMDFEFTPFADANFSLDFDFDLDSFTGGEDSRMMHQPNGSKFDWNL